MTELQKNQLIELNYRHAEVMIAMESLKDAIDLWRTGMLSEVVTDKRYKSCLTVIGLAIENLQKEELEPMQELIELLTEKGD